MIKFGQLPLGKAHRNADLGKMFIKGSSCHAPDDLTVGEPEGLTDVAVTNFKVCKSLNVDIEIGLKTIVVFLFPTKIQCWFLPAMTASLLWL